MALILISNLRKLGLRASPRAWAVRIDERLVDLI